MPQPTVLASSAQEPEVSTDQPLHVVQTTAPPHEISVTPTDSSPKSPRRGQRERVPSVKL